MSSNSNAEKIAQLRKAIPAYRPPSGPSSLPSSASFANAPSQAALSGNSDPSDDIFAAEREMLTSIAKKSTSGPIANSQSSISTKISAPVSSNNINPNNIAISSTGNLQQSIVGRLATLEAAQRNLRSELVHREREVLTLRNDVEAAKADAKAARNVIAFMEEEAAISSRDDVQGRNQRDRGNHVAHVDEIKELREEILALKEDNARMRQNAKEFEAFLLDYGLVWVGGGSNSGGGGTSKGGENDASSSSSRSRKGSDAAIDDSTNNKIDFPVLILKLRQLSALAGEGKGGVIVSKNGAHQLEKRPSVPITLHKDGFLLYRGPFRAWCEEDSVTFLADVLDGYFPSEFKDSHPEGVIFDVIDQSSKRFLNASHGSNSSSSSASDKVGSSSDANNSEGSSGSSFAAFSGQGRSLSSAGHPPPRPSSAAAAKMDGRVFSLAAVGGPTMLTHDPSTYGTANPMSAKSLLAALPEKIVTKDGDIVNIKEGVAGVLGIASSSSVPGSSAVVGKSNQAGGSTSSAAAPAGILVETSVLADMRRMTQEALIGGGGNESAPLSPPYEVATVQIRISGKESSTLIFKMKFEETIGDLRRYLDLHRGGGSSSSSYELRSSYPPSAFTDLNATMKASGLTPNATIMYRQL
jgi:hypothetical protein